MTSYRFIGTGVTDSSGVARLTKDPNGQTISGYVGTGSGEIDFVASLDNPISQGSIVSGTYPVIDGVFYDKGLDGTGQHNDNWESPSNKISLSRSSSGTTLTMGTGITWGYLYAQSSSTYFDWGFALEFDIVDYTDSPAMRFVNENNTSKVHTFNGNGHWKITFNSNSITVLKDGQTQTHWLSDLVGSTKLKVYWELSNDTDMVKYKDFVIYPI